MADVSSVPFINYAGQQADAQATQAQVGQTQAQTGLINQQSQSAAMQNQLMRARMPLIMQALSDYSNDQKPASPSSASPASETKTTDESGVAPTGADPNSSWYDPATVDAGLRAKYFVPPVLPQEAKNIQRAALIGDPGLLENAKMQRQMRIEQQTAASQYDSNNGYEALSAVVDADPGRAMAQLEAIAPNTVAKIRKQLPNDADEDAAARAYAAHVAGSIHQYTGRDYDKRADGVYVDKVTGRPIPGVEKSGLSTDQWTTLAKSLMETKPFPDGQGHEVQTPIWRTMGAPSLDAAIMQAASHAGVYGAHSTVGGVPKAVTQEAASRAAAAVQKGGPPTTPPEGATTTNGQPDPVMSKALADHSYDFVPPRHAFGTALSPDEQEQKNKQTAAAVSLKEDMDKGVMPAQQAQTFYKAAQDILDSKGASAGKWASVMAHAGSWVPGIAVPAATNYQELAKYLGNAALQAGKAIFPKMTDKASALSLEKLNPSPNMTEPAIRNMIGLGTRMAQYTLDGAQKVGAYLKSGKDATRFQSWYNKYYPMPNEVVGKGANASGASAAPAQKYSDAQIAKWAQTHGVDPAKARTFLLGSK